LTRRGKNGWGQIKPSIHKKKTKGGLKIKGRGRKKHGDIKSHLTTEGGSLTSLVGRERTIHTVDTIKVGPGIGVEGGVNKAGNITGL